MRYCKKCVMPDTKPDLFFDDENVCIACRCAEYKNRINWNDRLMELERLLNKYRSNNARKYDCIIPVSGGKDSTFQVLIMKKVYKMNPLCVHFEPTYPSEIGRANLENLRKLGVDLISFKPDPSVYTKICKEAFIRVGDHEWPNHVGIFTIPVRIAVQFNIPLIVWGENSQLEYGGPEKATKAAILDRNWLEEFGGLLGLRVNDLSQLGIDERDIKPYVYPDDREIKKIGMRGIFLGYYLKWDARRQVELVKRYGFNVRDGPVEGTYVNYENLDDEIVSIHDYFKYLKFGFGRATDHASLDIRNGKLSRKDALKLVAKYDGKLFSERVDMFCKRFSMKKEEFYAIVEKFANKSIFKLNNEGSLVWEDGQLINLRLLGELRVNGISPDNYADTSDIETKIEKKNRELIEKEGYVTGLIHAKDIDN